MIDRHTKPEVFYIEAPEVPVGMTLQAYRRHHRTKRRRNLLGRGKTQRPQVGATAPSVAA